jgi:hypothetical protein
LLPKKKSALTEPEQEQGIMMWQSDNHFLSYYYSAPKLKYFSVRLVAQAAPHPKRQRKLEKQYGKLVAFTPAAYIYLPLCLKSYCIVDFLEWEPLAV